MSKSTYIFVIAHFKMYCEYIYSLNWSDSVSNVIPVGILSVTFRIRLFTFLTSVLTEAKFSLSTEAKDVVLATEGLCHRTLNSVLLVHAIPIHNNINLRAVYTNQPMLHAIQ